MRDLPFLLKLLDDPSPKVQAKVGAKLRALGRGVWDEIHAQNLALSPAQRAHLDEIFALDRDEQLLATWSSIQSLSQERLYLENALFALTQWQSGESRAIWARETLDSLGEQFLALENRADSVALSHFLFEHCGLGGVSASDYYNPLNSNLAHVLEKRVGLPITLACVFILVGDRVGLRIEGCNFPGHFLARDGRRRTIFDPYNKGRMLSAREVATLQKAAPLEMETSASAREITARVLRNLSLAYHHEGQGEKSGLMLTLLRAIDGD